jgi:hypothetical protein
MEGGECKGYKMHVRSRINFKQAGHIRVLNLHSNDLPVNSRSSMNLSERRSSHGNLIKGRKYLRQFADIEFVFQDFAHDFKRAEGCAVLEDAEGGCEFFGYCICP